VIQRYFKIGGSQDAIRREMLAFDSWPQWWPGVQTVNVLKADPEQPLVAVVIKTVTTIQMTLQFDLRDVNTIKFRQVKGWFKSYKGEYALTPSPDGSGTTVKITTELESGMMVPKGMVYTKLSATLAQLEEALNNRLGVHGARPSSQGRDVKASSGPAAPRAATARPIEAQAKPASRRRKLGHVFSTRDGLEVWVGGRPYLLRPVR
jgi:hypothetical protein